MIDTIRDFLKLESASGITLIGTTILAIILANSPLEAWYDNLIHMQTEVRIGSFILKKTLLHWINDGLMTIFFFVVGLELKRGICEGELSTIKKISLPSFGAIGGMVVPTIIYISISWGLGKSIEGWAIPAATDIAFALGVLSLLGRVPAQLKVFLVSLAIFDDLGAIAIIAIFFTESLSIQSLVISFFCILILATLNKNNVSETAPYITVGFFMWLALLKSGIHATIAGVILAAFIPLKTGNKVSPLRELEHNLHTAVAFGIIPLFAFFNAGISFTHIKLDSLLNHVSIGIIVGLFFGKQIGIFSFCWLAVKLKLAHLPKRVKWQELYGVSIICGVGFTMSLFISTLSDMGEHDMSARLGILLGSFLSGICGYLFLSKTIKSKPNYDRKKCKSN